MLAELALQALTPAAPLARRFGLLREGIALWSRGQRQRKAWEPHQARCRAIIAEIAASLPRRRKVVVLGSGPARDIPLDMLCTDFDEVVLVDIVHLPLLRLKLWRQAKVSLVSRDLTGAMAWLAGEAEGRQDPLADLARTTASTSSFPPTCCRSSPGRWPTGWRRTLSAPPLSPTTSRPAASAGISTTSPASEAMSA